MTCIVTRSAYVPFGRVYLLRPDQDAPDDYVVLTANEDRRADADVLSAAGILEFIASLEVARASAAADYPYTVQRADAERTS